MTAQQDEFARPGKPGESFDYNDYKGSLLLFDVIGLEDHIPTVNTKPGEKSPAVRADLFVLDGPKANTEHIDALIFPKILQSQLRRMVGQRVLGRLGQGVAKPGQTAPWTLAEATDADVSRAREWSRNHASASTAVGSAEPPF